MRDEDFELTDDGCRRLAAAVIAQAYHDLVDKQRYVSMVTEKTGKTRVFLNDEWYARQQASAFFFSDHLDHVESLDVWAGLANVCPKRLRKRVQLALDKADQRAELEQAERILRDMKERADAVKAAREAEEQKRQAKALERKRRKEERCAFLEAQALLRKRQREERLAATARKRARKELEAKWIIDPRMREWVREF